MMMTKLLLHGPSSLPNYEIKHNWNDAIAECQLYGGWLVDVTGLEEHNCLLSFGKSQGLNTWYWTDGKRFYVRVRVKNIIQANDQASRGSWVHASTKTNVT